MATSYSTANPRRRFAAAKPKHFAVSADYQPSQTEKGTRKDVSFLKNFLNTVDLRPAEVRLLKFLPFQIWGPNCP